MDRLKVFFNRKKDRLGTTVNEIKPASDVGFNHSSRYSFICGRRDGFTLVELIVTITIALVLIGTAGGFILFGSNIYNRSIRNHDAQVIASTIADYVKNQLTYAGSLRIVDASTPPTLEDGEQVLYIGNPDNNSITNKGELFFRRGDDEGLPMNAFSTDFYGGSVISMDFNVEVAPEQPKVFKVTITAYDARDLSREAYTISKTFRLVNSTETENPTGSISRSSLSRNFCIVYSGVTQKPGDFTVDGDDPTQQESVYTVPESGKYLIECWGAYGEIVAGNPLQGRGEYARGIVQLSQGEQLWITGGGAGANASGFNQGASDVMVLSKNSNYRIIVAGGGSSPGWFGTGTPKSYVLTSSSSLPAGYFPDISVNVRSQYYMTGSLIAAPGSSDYADKPTNQYSGYVRISYYGS